MKRIILTLALTMPSISLADPATELGKIAGKAASSEPVRRAGEAFSNTITTFTYETLCNGTTFSKAAQCYMTPSGKRVWELDEPERSEWMKIAREKIQAQTRLDVQDRNHQRLETQREQARAEENALHCEFWLQQADSDRTFKQIARYCQ